MNFCVAILILKMEENKQHFQHIYFFKKGKNTTETQKKIYALYGEGAVTDKLINYVYCRNEISLFKL